MKARRAAWLFSVLLALACASDSTVSEISAEELLALTDMPLVLDVRSPEEFASGHVPGATNVAYDQVESRLAELGEPREVVVYCERGPRAAKAASVLDAAGFTVRHLTGDMSGWRDAGLPVAR